MSVPTRMTVKLSTKGKYGVRALFEIARNYGKGPLAIKEIAERQQISLSYLEQILHRLGKAGIIERFRNTLRKRESFSPREMRQEVFMSSSQGGSNSSRSLL